MAKRVLIDPGSHHLLNLGDVAMLQVCVERLRGLWSHPDLRALTVAPELLDRLCPGVAAIDATGRYDLVAAPPRLRGPRPVARARLAFEGRRRGGAVAAYVAELLAADVLVLSGRGGLTDAFADEAGAVLAELELAAAIGLPTALLGQGLGPLDDPRLREQAARVLPSVRLIALREERGAARVLAPAGVDAARTVVTGDDAIEPAFRARRAPDDQRRLGINVRVAAYSGIGAAEAEAVARAASRVAERHGAELQPIAISTHPAENDHGALATVLGDRPPPPNDPAGAIELIGGCRTAVVGSYHAAVFALAQGIPAVGLAASPYYAEKFRGLAAQFGAGCRVVELDRPGGLDEVEPALEELWRDAPALRDELLAAAERQIERGHDAYARLAQLV